MKRLASIACLLALSGTAAAEEHTFDAGSLIIPMDTTHQETPILRAYGLVFALLREGVRVHWVIDPEKSWAGTDVEVGANAYRGGPFVIEAAERDEAQAVIDTWGVTVHEASAAFTTEVYRRMWHAPVIAVLADGGEDVALGYLDAAGIPPPDLVSPVDVMGDLGTCDESNRDHENGALFEDGMPRYDVVVVSGWTVQERETVVCDSGALLYHGHELVAELRAFAGYPAAVIASSESVLALENTEPVAAEPFWDDPGRIGHFLTNAGLTAVPAPGSVAVLHPASPYAQHDGDLDLASDGVAAFAPVVGYAGQRDVVDLGDGDADVRINGRINGSCERENFPFDCGGRISYAGGASASPTGARLFFDALLASDATERLGRPNFHAEIRPTDFENEPRTPLTLRLSVSHGGLTAPRDIVVRLSLDEPGTISGVTDGTIVGGVATWSIPALGVPPEHDGDPASSAGLSAQFRVPEPGRYHATAQITYRALDGERTAEIPIVVDVLGPEAEPVGFGCCAASSRGGGGQAGLILLVALMIRKRRHRVPRP